MREEAGGLLSSRFLFLFVVTSTCYFLLRSLLNSIVLLPLPSPSFTSHLVCSEGNELFSYGHPNNTNQLHSSPYGLPFSCSILPTLKKFKLTNAYALPKEKDMRKRKEPNYVFVLAADSSFYGSARAVISSIQRQFGGERKKYRIVFYDLGGVKENKKRVDELSGVCHLELRTFHFDDLPSDVRGKKVFAWKIFILAEMFNELNPDEDLMMYCDSSIYFESPDFAIFFNEMASNHLTPIQMSGYAGHSIQHATHPDMYMYLPPDQSIFTADMQEANLILMRKCEGARQILKWAMLCSLTVSCIEPKGARLGCGQEGLQPPGECHRQDQSLLNILLGNMEVEMIREGHKDLKKHTAPDHPKQLKQRHQTRRGQTESLTPIDNCNAQKKIKKGG